MTSPQILYPDEGRRLTVILAADIFGYSALMGQDELRTVHDLKGHQAVVLPMVGNSGGRVIDTAGDGIFAEFPSVQKAVRFSVALQMVMAERNRDVNMDIGATVHVDSWNADGTTTVQYRGSMWQASAFGTALTKPGNHRIKEVIGSRLILKAIA